ncbi:YceD family protein [Microlunatus flavus]|uniref:DUF177 domain-containing protein n=1 Tax=Microlunatus flavus TaxID=1036181 RepID=A0A1H9DMM1_9ACTN|nr:YceD family protein [Microlunatus flavus]SEQ14746.1 uncharacterized protein SAMN05421756_102594 [Microlunatus flavus]
MRASQPTVDPRSPLVFDTRALGRRAGAMTTVRTSVPAPAGLGTEVIGVPEGAPIELDLRFEAVVEGVLVTGTAAMEAVGECVRCLIPVSVPVEVDVQELFVHDAASEDDEEVSVLAGDYVDLEPVLRDDVVLDLPFQPLCTPDCSGLCPTCGVRLDDHPGHHHDADADPRWAALGALDLDDTDDPARGQVEQDVPHPYNRSGLSQGGELSR